MEKREKLWTKQIKFILNVNIKENIYDDIPMVYNTK